MAAILRRLPSFRRSSSQQSRSSVDEVRTTDNGTVGSWTSEEARGYITNLDAEELRRLVSNLAETHSVLREALQKHAQEHPTTSRPPLPHSSTSMSKKRRADDDLDRVNNADIASTPSKPSAVKALVESYTKALDTAKPNELLPRAPVSNEEKGEKVIIEGQTGIIILPASAEELNEAAEGSVSGDSTHEAGHQSL